MTTASLGVEGLHLWYERFHALRGIDIALPKGDFLALLGPSGCGKTSLLRSIAGFVHPQRGRILIDGRDIVGLPPRARNLGMVFQQYALFPHLSAEENVAFGLRARRVPRSELRPRVARALDMVGLSHLADRKPRQLSGGQQQRVALARALVVEPDVLLLDEPLGALDRKLRIEMQGELRALQKRLEITAVFVTHDQEEAMAMADRIALMRDGVIEQVGSPQDAFAAPRTPWAAEFIGSGNLLRGALRPDGDGTLRLAAGAGIDITVPERLAAGVAGEEAVLFVRSERTRLVRADATSGAGPRVAAHRFLGVHVEVRVDHPGGAVTALMDPEAARAFEIGAPVVVSAAGEDCRFIRSGERTTSNDSRETTT